MTGVNLITLWINYTDLIEVDCLCNDRLAFISSESDYWFDL